MRFVPRAQPEHNIAAEHTSPGAQHSSLTVKPGGLDGADEELGSVGVGPGVCHGHLSGTHVLELEVLICELLAIDGLAACAVTLREVTTLMRIGTCYSPKKNASNMSGAFKIEKVLSV